MNALLCNTRISTERAPCQRSQVRNELKLWNKFELDELTAVKDSFKLTPSLMLSIGPSLEDNVNIGLTMVEPLAQPFTFDGVWYMFYSVDDFLCKCLVHMHILIEPMLLLFKCKLYSFLLQINNQKEQITKLQSKLDNLTNAVADRKPVWIHSIRKL